MVARVNYVRCKVKSAFKRHLMMAASGANMPVNFQVHHGASPVQRINVLVVGMIMNT